MENVKRTEYTSEQKLTHFIQNARKKLDFAVEEAVEIDVIRQAIYSALTDLVKIDGIWKSLEKRHETLRTRLLIQTARSENR